MRPVLLLMVFSLIFTCCEWWKDQINTLNWTKFCGRIRWRRWHSTTNCSWKNGEDHQMDVNVSLENQLKKRKYIFCTGVTWSHETLQNIICEDEFLQLNYQLLDNERGTKFKFVKRQSYHVGKNILQNRMHDKIDNINANPPHNLYWLTFLQWYMLSIQGGNQMWDLRPFIAKGCCPS